MDYHNLEYSRCCNHGWNSFVLTDVMSHCAKVLCGYFCLHFGVFTTTSSHICGRWYLLMFLLGDGSLTLYINGFIYWSGKIMILPAYNAEVVCSCGMTCGIIVGTDGWGSLQMYFWIFLQMLCQVHQCILPCSPPLHTYIYISAHSYDGWFLCPSGWPGGLWSFCLLWSAYECHVCCRCFYSSHIALWCKVPPCECSYWCFMVGCSWCCWNSLWTCLACCFWFWLSLDPNLDTCSFAVLA